LWARLKFPDGTRVEVLQMAKKMASGKLRDVPVGDVACERDGNPNNILEFYNVRFAGQKRGEDTPRALIKNLSFTMEAGTICSVASLSAWDFSLFTDMLMRTYPYPGYAITDGEIWFKGVKITALTRKEAAQFIRP
jgi:ABC-type glutathione transport system ATPase component